MYLKDKQI